MNVSDADAAKYIKIFTDLSQEEIAALEAEQEAAPHLRPLQKRLAKEVTVMVHSLEDYEPLSRLPISCLVTPLTRLC